MGRLTEYFAVLRGETTLNSPRVTHLTASSYRRPVEAKPPAVRPKAKAPPPRPIPKPELVGALPPLKVFDIIFGRCRGDARIAIGSVRPTKRNPDPHQAALSLVPVSARREWLPEIFAWHVDQMQVFIPQGLSAKSRRGDWERPIGDHARLCWFGAQNRHVYELATLVMDLDVWREDTDPRFRNRPAAALGQAVQMALEREIPLPALAAYSGRGAYLFWLLRGEDDTHPPRATRSMVGAWSTIAAALHGEFRHMGSDSGAAGTLAKWYKRPGVIDPKTGNEVIYLTFGTADVGNLPLWRLSELQEFLGAHHHGIDDKGELPKLPTPKAKADRKASKRAAARWLKHADDIDRLNNYRGGMPKGFRSVTAWLYYRCLRAALRAGVAKDQETADAAGREAFKKTVELAQTFRPPLTPAEVKAQVKDPIDAHPARWFRSETLAAKLGVTEDDVAGAGLISILPEDMAAAKRAARKADRAIKRADRANRDRLIEELVAKGLTDSEIAARVGTNRSTAWRHRQKRRPKRQQATSLFVDTPQTDGAPVLHS